MPRFSGAKSGLVLRSWFRLNSNSSTALYPTLLFYRGNFTPLPPLLPRLNESPWSLIAPVWASTEISDFQKKIKNYFLSHLIPGSLEHHHGSEKWCSGQLFILIYCSDYFANNKGLVFSLQWPARWIKGENIHFNVRNLWDLLLRMVRLIFTNDQRGRNSRDNFLLITNYKKCENYFYEKNLSWDPKTLKFEYKIFFSEFCEIYFREHLDLKNFVGLIFANLQNNCKN